MFTLTSILVFLFASKCCNGLGFKLRACCDIALMRYPFRNITFVAMPLQDAVLLRLNSQIGSNEGCERERRLGKMREKIRNPCDEGDADEGDAVEKMKEKAAVGCGEDEVHVSKMAAVGCVKDEVHVSIKP
ncbi:hypothetical protein R6Q59_033399 [Mikania micrantha]